LRASAKAAAGAAGRLELSNLPSLRVRVCVRACVRACHRERYNLNAISHDSAIGLIRMVLARGYNVTEVRKRTGSVRLRPCVAKGS
jgi:hypothetical protein